MVTNVMGFKLNINTELIEYLSSEDYTIDDLFVVYCIENEKKEFLKSYLDKRNSDQKIALFQRFQRKLLIERLSELEEFDIDNYNVIEKGEELLLNCNSYFTDLDVIISDLENGNEKVITDFNKFVSDFIELWPQKIRNKGGEALRSNIVDTTKKLKQFITKYKYSYEIILAATKKYLQEQSTTRYEFCSAAMFFISKHSISKLANECENIQNNPEDTAKDISAFTDQIM